MSFSSDKPEFWESRYQQKQTPWDLGEVAPPFVALLKEHGKDLKPGKMAALGSGYGHDAAYFARQGFEVLGLDYASGAVQEALSRYGQYASFRQADIFELDPDYDHQFDYVLEHTCFCAIPPVKRQNYVEVVQRLLKPGGYFIALILAFVEADGPPYPSTKQELQSLFSQGFELKILEQAENSVANRHNQEFICLFRKPL